MAYAAEFVDVVRHTADEQMADPRFRRLLATLCWSYDRRPRGWSAANVVSETVDGLHRQAVADRGLPQDPHSRGARSDKIGQPYGPLHGKGA